MKYLKPFNEVSASHLLTGNETFKKIGALTFENIVNRNAVSITDMEQKRIIDFVSTFIKESSLVIRKIGIGNDKRLEIGFNSNQFSASGLGWMGNCFISIYKCEDEYFLIEGFLPIHYNSTKTTMWICDSWDGLKDWSLSKYFPLQYPK